MRIELAGRQPLLRRETPVHRADRKGSLVIDTRRLLFASPLDLAAIAALTHAAAARNASVAVITPEARSVTSYLQRMDVFTHLPTGSRIEGDLPSRPRGDRSATLTEVSPVSQATVERLVHRMGQMTWAHLEPGVRGLAFQSVGELIENAVSHGESEIGAFASAQVYSGATTGRPGLEFAICDTGVGILAHLRRNPQYQRLPDAHRALECALRPGVTGTGDKRGYGLHDVFRIARHGRARLMLRSGDGIASVVVRQPDHGRPRYATVTDPITGTWAWLRVHFS